MGIPAEDPLTVRTQLARISPTDSSVSTQHRLLEGDPAEEILKVAQGEGVDMIVMGTHGATGLTRLLMGSVAEHVLRKAPCPVLTVRPHAAAGA
jgi:nucleotide-binding universal stress UspA family protein